jgi:hypothetical protein
MRSLLLLLTECAAVLTLVQLCVLNAGLTSVALSCARGLCFPHFILTYLSHMQLNWEMPDLHTTLNRIDDFLTAKQTGKALKAIMKVNLRIPYSLSREEVKDIKQKTGATHHIYSLNPQEIRAIEWSTKPSSLSKSNLISVEITYILKMGSVEVKQLKFENGNVSTLQQPQTEESQNLWYEAMKTSKDLILLSHDNDTYTIALDYQKDSNLYSIDFHPPQQQ